MSRTAKKTTKPLRQAQVRILAVLAKTDKPMTRAEIAEAAKADQAGLVEMIGSSDPKKRKANDAKHFPSLLSLALVKEGKPGENGMTYTITAKGRKQAAK